MSVSASSYLRRLILLLPITLLQSCGGTEGNSYFPLQEGAFWLYRMDYKNMDGQWHTYISYENFPHFEEDGEKIYPRKTINGREYHYVMNEQGVQVQKYDITEAMVTHTEPNEYYVFKFPLEQGQTWNDESISQVLIKTGPPQKTEFHINAKLPVNVTIESLNDRVEVPAGVFDDCMKVTLKGSGFYDAGNYVGHTIVSIDEERWYAPDVGLVKSVRKEKTTNNVITDGHIIMQLEKFRPR